LCPRTGLLQKEFGQSECGNNPLINPVIADESEEDCRDKSFQEIPLKTNSSILWLLFIAAIVASFFVHELGHCGVAWLHGYAAIPTPAKEYLFEPIPERVQYQVALGGILGSVAALLAGVSWLYRHHTAASSALLAGVMTAPGFYTLRFILAGRGHDATEFQEAQAALGLSYSGHAADWLFVSLFVITTVLWFLRTRTRLTPRLVGRLALGAIAALVVVVLLQNVNNALFDPLFQPTPNRNHPLTSERAPDLRAAFRLAGSDNRGFDVGSFSLCAKINKNTANTQFRWPRLQ
jgi:hypothetical protein